MIKKDDKDGEEVELKRVKQLQVELLDNLNFDCGDSESVKKDRKGTEIVESFKPEEITLKGKDQLEKDSKMGQNGDGVHDDGAEEKMLSGQEKENLAKKDEVKFITGDQQNGDAKIDIGHLDKAFTGMTKEELMKYANDPFWIRLRWSFFILFWLLWAAMLIGAILIIIDAPKCAAPTPLPWYKQGPLIKFESAEAKSVDIDQATKIKAKGVIYELPAEETYSVKQPEVEKKVKQLVESYKNTGVKVILDITPNYVTNNSKFFIEAEHNLDRRSAFIWFEGVQVPVTWRSIDNRPAWHELKPQNFVLSQFGEGKYDLFMNDLYVKNELKSVLKHLLDLGVKGFRFSNAKYFIINKDLNDESPAVINNNHIHDQYAFWTHSHTTFQEGLGDLLYEFTNSIKNATNEDIFLSVSEDTVRPEVFKTKSGVFGIDLPIYNRFTNALEKRLNSLDKVLHEELQETIEYVGNTTWMQWIYNSTKLGHKNLSAYYMLLSLLPGTPVIPANSEFLNISENVITQIDNLRLSPSYMHGDFNIYHSGEIIGYTRIKAGNPGFFVVFNPTGINVVGNFSYAELPEKMTFDLLSANYNVSDVVIKGKVSSDSIQLSPFSTAILTYVPVKKN